MKIKRDSCIYSCIYYNVTIFNKGGKSYDITHFRTSPNCFDFDNYAFCYLQA